MLFLRRSLIAVSYREKLECKHGKGKSYGIFTHKVGWAVCYMLKNKLMRAWQTPGSPPA